MKSEMDVDSTIAEPELSPGKIVVASDLTQHSNRTLEYAGALALKYGARILLLHVIDPSFFWAFPLEGKTEQPAQIREELGVRLDALASSLRHKGVECETTIREGNIRDVIAKMIDEEKIDLLLLGAHFPGSLRQLVVGSMFNATIHEVSCPVITIGSNALPISGREPNPFERILFATDFGTASVRAAAYAVALKNSNRSELIVTHVRTPHERYCDAQRLKFSVRELIPALTNVDFAAVPLNGDPVRALSHLSRSEHADLIVMGVKRASRAATMLSDGIAHEVICRAQCPVLTVACEPRAHVSPPAFIDELAGTLV